jgi:hypothetical protein
MIRLLLVCLMMTCSVSWAEYTLYRAYEDGEILFIDRDQIKRKGGFARMWQTSRYSEIQKNNFKLSYNEITVLNEYDCANEKQIVLNLTYRKDGNIVFDTNTESAKWFYLEPGTRGYNLLEIACDKK